MPVRKPLVQVGGTLTELPAADNINVAASDITSGVIATARLASSGTASSSTFLRGDQVWATPPSSAAATTLNEFLLMGA